MSLDSRSKRASTRNAAVPTAASGLRRRMVLGGSAAAAAWTLAPMAGAQSGWPNKPIRMLVGYTPGGFTDNMARAVGEPLGRVLGQPMLFDYKPGANSQIAVDMVAKAAPDGYTLTTVIAAHSANPSLYPKMPFDAQHDIVPVALTGVAPLILVANASFPPNNVAELVAYAKARPGSSISVPAARVPPRTWPWKPSCRRMA